MYCHFNRVHLNSFKPIPVKIMPCARLIILDDFSFCNNFSPKLPAKIAIIENTMRVNTIKITPKMLVEERL